MIKALKFILMIFGILLTGSLYGQSDKETLIFHSGFEPGSKVINRDNDADIVGIDRSFSDHNDWVNDFDNHPDIGNFNLQYQGGDSTMRYAKIIVEPRNPSNHVLHFWLDAPNVEGKKGRIQGIFTEITGFSNSRSR